ncbi:MAG: PASTA domain-containing protein [Gemmatimonadaceae bacterium]
MNFRLWLRRAMPYFIAAVLGFTAAYIVIAVAVFPPSGGPDDVTVPSLTGMTISDATSRLSKLGFKLKQGATRPSEGAPAGTIIEQNPLGGAVDRPGATVTVVTSAGQRELVVPDTKGMARRDAERALEEAGFAVGSATQQPSDQARGTVLATTPAAGEKSSAGSVTLVISSGPSSVTLPNVVGRSYADARSALEQIGLLVSGSGLDSASTEPAGTVVSQSPSPGRTVPSGTTIQLRLSAGIGLVAPRE